MRRSECRLPLGAPASEQTEPEKTKQNRRDETNKCLLVRPFGSHLRMIKCQQLAGWASQRRSSSHKSHFSTGGYLSVYLFVCLSDFSTARLLLGQRSN